MGNNLPAGRPRPTRRADTLLELLLASSLMAIALVPTLKLIRQGLELNRQIETRNVLATFCVSKLEEHLALATATWTTGTFSGDFAAEGYSGVRYQAIRSEDAGDGGIEDQLMAVTVTAWEDEDADDALDAGELKITLRSKIAKLATYQDEAGT